MDSIELLVATLKDIKEDIKDIKADIKTIELNVKNIELKMVTREECEKKRNEIEDDISSPPVLSTKQIVALTSLVTAVLSGILAIVKVFVLK